jgi:hypothetical protein
MSTLRFHPLGQFWNQFAWAPNGQINRFLQ